ncbi:hypothetical protein [Microbacterium foliorum]|nr:hypothetical protein [Microbacterium foliorum]
MTQPDRRVPGSGAAWLVAAMGCVVPLTLVGALLVAAGARRDGASA